MKTGLPWRMLAPDSQQIAIWNKWLTALRKTPCVGFPLPVENGLFVAVLCGQL
jgi:hypothetical protein